MAAVGAYGAVLLVMAVRSAWFGKSGDAWFYALAAGIVCCLSVWQGLPRRGTPVGDVFLAFLMLFAVVGGVATAWHLSWYLRDLWKLRKRRQLEARTPALLAELRRRAADAVAIPSDQLSSEQKRAISSLSASLIAMADLEWNPSTSPRLERYLEADELLRSVGDSKLQCIVAGRLAKAYYYRTDFKDLDRSEAWARRAISVAGASDKVRQSAARLLLGAIALDRAVAERQEGGEPARVQSHLDDACQLAEQALAEIPRSATDGLAEYNYLMGGIRRRGYLDLDGSIRFYDEGIRYDDKGKGPGWAGDKAAEVATALLADGQIRRARHYARQALYRYRQYGDRQKQRETEQLLLQIKRAGTGV
jgi:hypothetical protein